jgi:hypothetical protein
MAVVRLDDELVRDLERDDTARASPLSMPTLMPRGVVGLDAPAPVIGNDP